MIRVTQSIATILIFKMQLEIDIGPDSCIVKGFSTQQPPISYWHLEALEANFCKLRLQYPNLRLTAFNGVICINAISFLGPSQSN